MIDRRTEDLGAMKIDDRIEKIQSVLNYLRDSTPEVYARPRISWTTTMNQIGYEPSLA